MVSQEPNGALEPPARSRWERFRLVVKVVELRLRFIALMAVTGLVFAYWDTLWNRYDKLMRPKADRVATAPGLEYYCPMHPHVVREQPGSCPICGMPLARRKKGEKARLPEGVTARVQLAPSRIRQAGIQTAEVAYAPLSETLSTFGFVEFDERRLAHIASKVQGMTRVEKLFVNFTGTDVSEGQVLAEVYSPELYQALQELLLARRSARNPPARTLLGDPGELVALAETKLELWGVTRQQLDRIEREGKAPTRFPILSPVSGHVTKKNVVEGQYVSEGQTLFEIADLSRVWVKAQVFEDQVGLVRAGEAVEATVDAFPGQVFAGHVAFLQPHLDPATRTMEIWYGLENPGHRLRPGMYATVTLKIPVAELPVFRDRIAATSPGPGSRDPLGAGPTAAEQRVCPVTGAELGSMGKPIAVALERRTVWTCCDACPPKLKANPAKYLAKLAPIAKRVALSDVPDRRVCPVTGARLGSMGAPVPVKVQGRTVWTCCDACPPKLKANPAKYLARLEPPPAGSVLAVPESAVIDTGERKIVYVETEPGVFEGRRVVLGPRSGDRYPVLDGLSLGEKVAAAGAFLIDAESRLNPTTRETGADADEKAPPGTDHHHEHAGGRDGP